MKAEWMERDGARLIQTEPGAFQAGILLTLTAADVERFPSELRLDRALVLLCDDVREAVETLMKATAI